MENATDVIRCSDGPVEVPIVTLKKMENMWNMHEQFGPGKIPRLLKGQPVVITPAQYKYLCDHWGAEGGWAPLEVSESKVVLDIEHFNTLVAAMPELSVDPYKLRERWMFLREYDLKVTVADLNRCVKYYKALKEAKVPPHIDLDIVGPRVVYSWEIPVFADLPADEEARYWQLVRAANVGEALGAKTYCNVIYQLIANIRSKYRRDDVKKKWDKNYIPLQEFEKAAEMKAEVDGVPFEMMIDIQKELRIELAVGAPVVLSADEIEEFDKWELREELKKKIEWQRLEYEFAGYGKVDDIVLPETKFDPAAMKKEAGEGKRRLRFSRVA